MSVWNISESLHSIILPPRIFLFTTELWSSSTDMPLIDVGTLLSLARMRRFVVATENAAVRRLEMTLKPHWWSPSQTAHDAGFVAIYCWCSWGPSLEAFVGMSRGAFGSGAEPLGVFKISWNRKLRSYQTSHLCFNFSVYATTGGQSMLWHEMTSTEMVVCDLNINLNQFTCMYT